MHFWKGFPKTDIQVLPTVRRLIFALVFPKGAVYIKYKARGPGGRLSDSSPFEKPTMMRVLDITNV